MSEIKKMTRSISRIVQNTEEIGSLLSDACVTLNELIQASVLVLDKDGGFIASFFEPEESSILNVKETPEGKSADHQLNDWLRNITETAENVPLPNFYDKDGAESKKYAAGVFPIKVRGQRAGTLLLYRGKEKFKEHELILAEICAAVISLSLHYSSSQVNAESSRQTLIVKSAISTLSYSELEAVLQIFEQLGGMEGFVIASKIADRIGITRSVIVNALRKLESAGVIESRSLGMKGTHIKILNGSFLRELRKLRA